MNRASGEPRIVSRLRSSHGWLALVLLLVAGFAVGSTFRYPLVIDDPFITYRYALNLLDGQGFVFNPGEHVLSTTAPLFSLLLAAFGLIFRDIPTLGFWLSVMGLALCSWFVYLLLDSLEMRSEGVLAALLTLLSPGLVLTLGLETGIYLALAFAATYLYLKGRYSPGFVLLALLTLTRNDGVLLAAILGLDLLWRKRRSFRVLVRPFILYVLIVAAWLAFAWWWFGSPFPFTLTAKIAQAQSGLWDPFAVGAMKWLREWVAGSWAVAILALIGLGWSVRRRSRLLLLGLWALAHVVAYSILGVAFYAWYVAPFLPVVALFAGIGAGRAGQWVAARVSTGAAVPAFIVAGGIVMIAPELRGDLSAGMQQPSPKAQVYRRAAEWIAGSTAPDATVDALEVGLIGYYDRRPTYDFVGLVDPSRIPYLRSLELADGVRRRAADYVVMIPPDVWLPQDPWFVASYRPVQEIRAPGFYSGDPLVIFRRVDSGGDVAESLPLNLSFDKRVELLGVDLFSKSVARGGALPVVLHLQAGEPLGKNYKFTLQLVGTENRMAAQSDTFYPSRRPEDGKPFADHQGLPVARNAPTGPYDLILAMYDADSGERVNLYDAEGQAKGDFVALGKIEIY